MIKRIAVAATCAVSLVGIPAAAEAIPSINNHLLSIVRVTTDSVTVKTSCFSDPPQTAIAFVNDLSISGAVPIVCDGTKQTVVIPLSGTLPVGERVFVEASISGDSGEINAFRNAIVHR